MITDLRHAARALARNPGFALTAVLTLALGIGSNTAIFSVVNSILLNPPGVSQPDRAAAERVRHDKLNLKSIATSAPDFADVRASTGIFSSAAILAPSERNHPRGASPQRFQ